MHLTSYRFNRPNDWARHAATLTVWLILFLTIPATSCWADDTDLPNLGGSGGGLFSSQQEAEIGHQVLRSLRRSGTLLNDPLTLDYLHTLVYRLVPNTPLEDRDLLVIAINDPQVNAFAVPGGIIGVNGGLFVHAQTEQEFAAVLAHELGHLSQRHFARELERQKTDMPWMVAGMITGFILAAVTHSDVGVAALAGTQAASVQNMLHYSRQNEREADRVGLQILADSGFDPRAMPRMFEELLRESRIQGTQLPEYLSDHPVTESRIADTRNRAEQYPRRSYHDSLEYHLVRSRMIVHFAESPDAAVRQFQAQLDDAADGGSQPLRYGLAVALIQDSQPEKAIPILNKLLQDNPERITYEVTLGKAEVEAGQADKAFQRLSNALSRNPGNLPIMTELAKVALRANQAGEAALVLRHLTADHPQDAFLWQELADAEGKAGNIVEVHLATAEYDLLMGDPDAAMLQLRQALAKAGDDGPMRDIIQQRMEDARKLQREMH